jgi:uncharacterized membrane protein YfcA
MVNTLLEVLLVLGAGMTAGALNSVAGGGSFISFPVLIALGLPPITANATNNLAMWVGTAGSMRGFEAELRPVWRRFLPVWLIGLAGGAVGAVLLLVTPETVFSRAIPWLILGATILFAVSPKLRVLPAIAGEGHTVARVLWPCVLATAIYGGYFGAGIGIINLALLTLSGVRDVHRANALKAFLGFAITGVANIPFIIGHRISWLWALDLALGAVLGAYAGARISQRVAGSTVRIFVIAVGITTAAVFFLRPAHS